MSLLSSLSGSLTNDQRRKAKNLHCSLLTTPELVSKFPEALDFTKFISFVKSQVPHKSYSSTELINI